MPMYDFLCTACGEKFELVAGDGAIACLPKCGSHATQAPNGRSRPLKTGAFPFKPGRCAPWAGACHPAARPPERAAAAAAAVFPGAADHNP